LQERQLPDVEQAHVQHKRPKHLQDSAVKHSLLHGHVQSNMMSATLLCCQYAHGEQR
jgi:hypothetical protein